MKITAMALMAWVAGTAAQASEIRQTVTVYVLNRALVPNGLVLLAQAQAKQMFMAGGIRVAWRTEVPRGGPAPGAIVMELKDRTPEDFLSGALAYAMPYEGVHITVFYDRIERMGYPPAVLAHIMVHEITHVLQGVNRHAETGVMKAHWSGSDLARMRVKPLAFTGDDLELLQLGLEKRASNQSSWDIAGRTHLVHR